MTHIQPEADIMDTIYIGDWTDDGRRVREAAANGYVAWNAPRPIAGETCWYGDFRHGKFYAIGDAVLYGAHNADMDASLVVALSREQIEEHIAQMCEERGAVLAEILDDFDGSWRDLAHAANLPWPDDATI